jgi:hypothetical protein
MKSGSLQEHGCPTRYGTDTDAGQSGDADLFLNFVACKLLAMYRNRLATVGRNDPCPCGSGKKHKKCHGKSKKRTPPPGEFVTPISVRQGSTPTWLKKLVEASIDGTFREASQPRGTMCVQVAMLAVSLLSQYGVVSRVVVGSACWMNYPHHFSWKGQSEYHAWVQTEYDEIVDLTCDALRDNPEISRRSPRTPAPPTCWTKRAELNDRTYTEVTGGATQLDVEVPGHPLFDDLARRSLQYARNHQTEFQERFGSG